MGRRVDMEGTLLRFYSLILPLPVLVPHSFVLTTLLVIPPLPPSCTPCCSLSAARTALAVDSPAILKGQPLTSLLPPSVRIPPVLGVCSIMVG